MKAIVMTALGGPEVLRLADVETPAPSAGQIRVRVKAAGVNPIDYKLRKTGAMGYRDGSILGFDAAGVVDAVGAGVADFKSGDAVFYSSEFGKPGSYAQFNLTRAELVVPMPAGLSFEQAAAIPLAGMTAYDCLMHRGDLRLGHTVLIAGANGGVGSIALQLAKAAGAFVYATCSSRSMDFVNSIPVVGGGKPHGPDRALNYQSENWSDIIKAECPVGLDLVFDCVGQDVVSRTLPIMKSSGAAGGAGATGGTGAESRIVSIVNPSGKLDEGYRKNVALHYSFFIPSRASLAALRTLLERRQLVPLIDSVLPLEQAGEAHRRLEAGGIKGKIILKIDD